jgi:hypothetical protein
MLLISWVGKWNEKLYIVGYIFIQWFTLDIFQKKNLPNIGVMENILHTIRCD